MIYDSAEKFEESDIFEIDYNQEIVEKVLRNKKLHSINLKNMYDHGQISVDETKIIDFENCLKSLQEVEIQSFIDDYFEEVHKNFTETIENSKYYKTSVEWVEKIKPSLAFIVDIQFDGENLLKQPYKLKLRYSGKQRRHITPIVLIERIFKNALIPGTGFEEILLKLIFKVEFFKDKMDMNSGNFIQAIFDYFRNKNQKNASGINHLVKIITQFYHEVLYLALDDNCIKIPYKLNDCRVVPTLDFGGEKILHSNEGSFIKALITILDGFESKLEKSVKLEKIEIAQLVYTVFALFDFMPLPKKITKHLKKIDINKHRYKGEPLDRLYTVATRHLLFVFEAYPKIQEHYSEDIANGFLNYVINGIKLEDLEKILSVESKDMAGLIKKLGIGNEDVDFDESYIKKYLTQDGFARQYNELNLNDFKKSIMEEMRKFDEYYKPASEHESDNTSSEEEKLIEDKIENYLEKILYHYLNNSDNNNMGIEEAIKTVEKIINLDKFFDKKQFIGTYNSKLKNINDDSSPLKIDVLRKKNQLSKGNNKVMGALQAAYQVSQYKKEAQDSNQLHKYLKNFYDDIRKREDKNKELDTSNYSDSSSEIPLSKQELSPETSPDSLKKKANLLSSTPPGAKALNEQRSIFDPEEFFSDNAESKSESESKSEKSSGDEFTPLHTDDSGYEELENNTPPSARRNRN